MLDFVSMLRTEVAPFYDQTDARRGSRDPANKGTSTAPKLYRPVMIGQGWQSARMIADKLGKEKASARSALQEQLIPRGLVEMRVIPTRQATREYLWIGD